MNYSIKSILSLLFSSFGIGIVGVLIQWTIAKQLNVDEFGSFSAAYNIVMLISPLAGLGIHQVLLRQYGEFGSAANNGTPVYRRYILLTTMFSISLLLFISFFVYREGVTGELIRILSLIVISQLSLQLLNTKYQLESNYQRYAIINFSYIFSRLVVLYFIVIFGFDLNVSLLSYSYSVLSMLFVLLSIKTMLYFSFDLDDDYNSVRLTRKENINLKTVFRLGWMYGVSGILYLIYYQSDIIIIEKYISPQVAGLYSIAYLIISVSYVLPSVVFQKYLLPKVHRWYYEKSENILKLTRLWPFYSFVIGAFIAIVLYLLSNFFVVSLFGEKYLHAVDYVIVLVWCIPIKFASSCVGLIFNLEPLITSKFKIMCFAAIANLTLNIILIPKYGAIFAAYTTVLSECIVLLLFFSIVNLRFVDDYKKTQI